MQSKISNGKNSHLHISVTTQMHEKISKEANKLGIPISEYVRIRIGEHYDLNEKALSILKKCRHSKYGTISYKQIFTKLCTHFSISKEECRSLLRRFEKEGNIVYVKQKGIKMAGLKC